ncbi:MAG: hypothetical protein CFE24_10905 [Flavobacterium sp. BFFFF2]|nr:MAG: hypothetical protein CFE24_10905 [Flavobacterium sp. BFFFF2]
MINKAILFFIGCTFLCVNLLVAQKEAHIGCGSDILHLKSMKENANYKKNYDAQNAAYQKWVGEQKKRAASNKFLPPTELVTLKVVFHDMSGSTSNFLLANGTVISGYQYIIDKLNAIYSGVNVGGKPAGNDTHIRFCLATQDEQGNNYDSHHITTVDFPLNSSDNSKINQIVTDSNSQPDGNISSNIHFFPVQKFINIYVGSAEKL